MSMLRWACRDSSRYCRDSELMELATSTFDAVREGGHRGGLPGFSQYFENWIVNAPKGLPVLFEVLPGLLDGLPALPRAMPPPAEARKAPAHAVGRGEKSHAGTSSLQGGTRPLSHARPYTREAALSQVHDTAVTSVQIACRVWFERALLALIRVSILTLSMTKLMKLLDMAA